MDIAVTGMGSVSAHGPSRGPLPRDCPLPKLITAWPTRGVRKAHLVEPFRPTDLVPGLRTRRLDRLSVWSLVAAGLAAQDAQLDIASTDPDRAAVVFGTGFGCLELSESYVRNAGQTGFAKTDPAVFPETLANSPAGHVARQFGMRGPNITLSCRGLSGEAALLQAMSLLRAGEADVVSALAGDVLTPLLFEWYEAARVLSADCVPSSAAKGFVPGEGAAAVVLEPAARAEARGAKVYALLDSGFMSGDSSAPSVSHGECPLALAELLKKLLRDGEDVVEIVSIGNGSAALDALEGEALHCVFGASSSIRLIAPKRIFGEFDGSGVLRLVSALSDGERPRGRIVMLGVSAGGGRAALSILSK